MNRACEPVLYSRKGINYLFGARKSNSLGFIFIFEKNKKTAPTLMVAL